MRTALTIVLLALVVAPFLLAGGDERAATVPSASDRTPAEPLVELVPALAAAPSARDASAEPVGEPVVAPRLAREFEALFADASDEDREAARAIFDAVLAGR